MSLRGWFSGLCGLVVAGGALTGCPGPDGDCVSAERQFQDEVFEPILKNRCITCHNDSGPAASTRLIIDENDMDRTRRGVLQVALITLDGAPLLTQKPSGAVSHGGGTVHPPGTPEIAALAAFAEKLRNPDSCDPVPFAEIACRTPETLPARVQVLTRDEMDTTLSVVFGIDDTPAQRLLPAEPVVNGYNNSADVVRMQPLRVEQVHALAADIAPEIALDVRQRDCFSQGGDERECTRAWLEEILPTAYRLVPSSEDIDPLLALYDGEIDRAGTPLEALTVAVRGLLVSPYFLYRRELGASGRLGAFETAENLAYVVTAGPPDEALLAAAVDGSIMDGDVRREHALRLFGTELGRRQFERFIYQWLDVRKIAQTEKSSVEYPKFGSATRTAMDQSLRLYVRHILDNEGTLQALLSSPATFWNSHLADVLGAESGGGGGGGGAVTIRLEEEDMAEEPNDLGYATGGNAGGSWIVWANGGVQAPFVVDDGGSYQVRVDVAADWAFDVGADFDVLVDDALLGSDHTDEYQAYETFTYNATLDAGSHMVTVRFTNDVYDEDTGADRNLYVDFVEITGPDGASPGDPGDPGESFGPELTLTEQAGRPGILTRAAVLAAHSTPDGSSPIRRGVLIRERVLCQGLPPPSSNVEMILPDFDEEVVTTRDRTEAHLNAPSCASCHALIDGLGYAFEGFDGVGAIRTEQGGATIDPSGSILSTLSTDGDFEDVHGFIGLLKDSDEVERCFAKNYRMYSLGAADDFNQSCVDGAVLDAFASSGGRFEDLLGALVASPRFVARSNP